MMSAQKKPPNLLPSQSANNKPLKSGTTNSANFPFSSHFTLFHIQRDVLTVNRKEFGEVLCCTVKLACIRIGGNETCSIKSTGTIQTTSLISRSSWRLISFFASTAQARVRLHPHPCWRRKLRRQRRLALVRLFSSPRTPPSSPTCTGCGPGPLCLPFAPPPRLGFHVPHSRRGNACFIVGVPMTK